jgi:type IV secretory pathway VirB10-like protein
MQKSYVVKLTVFFSDVDIYVREGDVCVHTPTENKLTIYRGGEILKTCVRTTDSIESMVKLGWIKHHQPAAEEAPAPVVVESAHVKVNEPQSDPKVAGEAPEPKTDESKTDESKTDESKTEGEEDESEDDAKSDESANAESNDESANAESNDESANAESNDESANAESNDEKVEAPVKKTKKAKTTK